MEEQTTPSGIVIPKSKEKESKQSPEFEMLMDRYDSKMVEMAEMELQAKDMNLRLSEAFKSLLECQELLKMVIQPVDMMMGRDHAREKVVMYLKSKGLINASDRY